MDEAAHNDLPEDVEDALIEALDLDADGREAALRALCDAHPDHAQAIRAAVANASERSVDGGASLAEAFRAAARGSERTIGGFRVLERIGEGTFGEVFRAEQSAPLRRVVALKVLRDRALRDDVLSRFEAERQVLASLDHPGIAKILDAGATDDGRPWFAMELVPEARSITRFCDEERVDLAGRLALVARVCDAVQHAHGRGVLHRDLKPGNVLCARVDGEPAPKIIDFGLAKMTAGRGAPTDAHETLAGAPVGTPLYASPEQVRGATDVDVRTDVYALGALLHELVSGEPPFGEHDLASLWATDVARFFEVVAGVDPEPPSRRACGSIDGADLRGDVDAIVGRALARSRDDRYPTVSELGADVRRAAAGEPVLARVPGLLSRAARTARRHRMATAAGLAVALVLAGLLAYALDRNAELESLRSQAETAAETLRTTVAELAEERTELERTTRRLQRDVRDAEEVRRLMRHAAASLAGAGEVTLQDWADRLVLPLASGADVWTPGVEVSLRRTVAWVLAGLQRDDDAQAQLEGALALLSGDDRDTRLERAATAHALADETGVQIGTEKAIELLRESRQIFDDELGRDAPETVMVEGDLAYQLVLSKRLAHNAEGLLLAIDLGRRLLLEDGDELGPAEADERLMALVEEVRTLSAERDLDGALRALDRILEPVLARPVLRNRLCNSLWGATGYEPLRPVAPVLLEAAISYGEREHGPGHDHVMIARRDLLRWHVDEVAGAEGAGADGAALVRAAAHAVRQARLEDVVAWPRGSDDLTGPKALRVMVEAAELADTGAIEAFARAVEATGLLDEAELASLRAELGP